MKLVFYGNVLEENIETEAEGQQKIRSLIDEFLPLALSIYKETTRLKMPRKIIHDFPSTLDKTDELYVKINKFSKYFGDKLLRIDYIPVSGDLALYFDEDQDQAKFLSGIGLEIAGGMGDIKLDKGRE